MMARRLLAPFAFLASSTVGHSLTSSTTFMDDNESPPLVCPMPPPKPHVSRPTIPLKLPIYDPPAQTYSIADIPPNQLELSIRHSRLWIYHSYLSAMESVHSIINHWIKVKKSVVSMAQSIRSPDEQLMPELLYIATSAFASSLVVRNRFILVRAFTWPIVACSSAYYFLPSTSTNLTNLILNNLPTSTQSYIDQAVQMTHQHLDLTQTYITELQSNITDFANQVRTDAQNIVPAIHESIDTVAQQFPSSNQVLDKIKSFTSEQVTSLTSAVTSSNGVDKK